MSEATRINLRDWNRVFPVYMTHSKRDWRQVFDTKGFFIARRATVDTKKASAAEIRKLRERAIIGTGTKAGKQIKVRDTLASTQAARILQASLRKAGKPAIRVRDLPAAVRSFIGARLRSIAYLKSGWIPAIKTLEPLADVARKPRMDNSGKVFKLPKGGAKPARNLWRTSCEIFNAAVTRKSADQGLVRYGRPGLQAAFDAEVRSMKDYIERKMTARAKSLGIRTR